MSQEDLVTLTAQQEPALDVQELQAEVSEFAKFEHYHVCFTRHFFQCYFQLAELKEKLRFLENQPEGGEKGREEEEGRGNSSAARGRKRKQQCSKCKRKQRKRKKYNYKC